MIQIWFNTGMMQYEVYVNGVKVNVIGIRIESETLGLPKATITANVEIVNEQPEPLKNATGFPSGV